jgi:hypothetical protein
VHFENVKVRHRAPIVRIMSRGRRLDSDEGDGLSDIGIKVNGVTVDHVLDPVLVRKKIVV